MVLFIISMIRSLVKLLWVIIKYSRSKDTQAKDDNVESNMVVSEKEKEKEDSKEPTFQDDIANVTNEEEMLEVLIKHEEDEEMKEIMEKLLRR